MNTKQANAIPMCEILKAIDRASAKQHNPYEVWFHSPLRNEKTPSFRVNTQTNRWYDFGEDLHGTVIDFVQKYLERTQEDYTVQDALRWLKEMMLSPAPVLSVPEQMPANTEPSIILVKIGELCHPNLLRYLEGRGIPVPLAKKHVREALLFNTRSGKQFSTLCLKNEDDGYELRSTYFKGCLGKKSISFVRGTETSCGEIHVFEGFMDYLSALTYQEDGHFKNDVIILNSVHLLPLAMNYIKTCPYKQIRTWLDNDPAGEEATAALRDFAAELGFKFETMNNLYPTYKDVNAWHMKMPRP